jgi:hypothetical protein
MLARRAAEGAGPSHLALGINSDRVELLPVGPLSLGALHSLLKARLGRTFARPTLLRLHEISGGNPFFALELARVLGTDIDPTQPLRVPETLEGLVLARLDVARLGRLPIRVGGRATAPHGIVARIVDDPIVRARHLALSTESPDIEIAAALEEASALASARGAPIVAAEFGEHALRLTAPDADDDRHRRATQHRRHQERRADALPR